MAGRRVLRCPCGAFAAALPAAADGAQAGSGLELRPPVALRARAEPAARSAGVSVELAWAAVPEVRWLPGERS